MEHHEIDYFASLGRIVLPNALQFTDSSVLLTGDGPFDTADIRALFPPSTLCFDHQQYDGEVVDVVVIGQLDFSPDALDSAYRAAAEPPRYLPQEGLLDELLFGHDWWNDCPEWLNNSLPTHEGLSYAKALFDTSFPWPETEAPESIGGVDLGGFQIETELHHLDIKSQVSRELTGGRFSAKTAIPELGLREVVETIASHCRVRRAQVGGRDRYRNAMAEWEHDLRRLKDEYWRGPNDFPWPTTEP